MNCSVMCSGNASNMILSCTSMCLWDEVRKKKKKYRNVKAQIYGCEL